MHHLTLLLIVRMWGGIGIAERGLCLQLPGIEHHVPSLGAYSKVCSWCGTSLWPRFRQNNLKFSRNFKGHFWNWNIAVRILPSQPASAVSAKSTCEWRYRTAVLHFSRKSLRNHWRIPVFRSHGLEIISRDTARRAGSVFGGLIAVFAR